MIKKVLIIRFNSIGDIVLTTPVVKSLSRAGYEVHYLSKIAYRNLLEPNPYIAKRWYLEQSLSVLITELKEASFDLIIDLHNNYRSRRVRSALGKPARKLEKAPIRMLLLTLFKIRLKPSERHIVDRFYDTISDLDGVMEAPPSPEFYFPDNASALIKWVPKDPYVLIAVGAGFKTKQIPPAKLIDVIDNLDLPVVLTGGEEDVEDAWKIVQATRSPVINLVGKLNIVGSAYLARHATVVLSGDTGMMHIANALDKPLVAVFGSTHPVLGYTPYGFPEKDSDRLVQNENLSCRPCTKQGRRRCPLGHFKCMRDITAQRIVENIRSLI